MLEAIKDESKGVRLQAVGILPNYDYPKVLELGRKFLQLNDDDYILAGINIIYKMGNVDDMQRIVLLMNDKTKTEGIRAGCVAVLGSIGNEKSIKYLIEVLSENDSVGHNAAVVLSQMTGQKFASNKYNWEKWWNEEGQDFSAIEFEISKLDNCKNSIELFTSVDRLGRLKAKEAVDILEKLRNETTNRPLQKEIVNALEKIGRGTRN